MHGPGLPLGVGSGPAMGPGTGQITQSLTKAVETAQGQLAGGASAAAGAEDKGLEVESVNTDSQQQELFVPTPDPNDASGAAPPDGSTPDAVALTQQDGTQQSQDSAGNNYGTSGGGSGPDQAADNSNQFLKLGQMVRTSQTSMAGGAAGAKEATNKAATQKAADKALDQKEALKADAKADDAKGAVAKAKGNELREAAREAEQGTSEDPAQSGAVHKGGGHGHASGLKAAKEEKKASHEEEQAVEGRLTDGSVAEDLKGVGIKTGADKLAEKAADDDEKAARDKQEELAAMSVQGGPTAVAPLQGETGKPAEVAIDAATAADVRTPPPDFSATHEVLRHAHPDGPDAIRGSLPPDICNAAQAMLEGQNPQVRDGQVPKGLTDLKPVDETRQLILTIIDGVPPVANGLDGDPTGVMLHTVARGMEPMPEPQPVGAEV